MDKDKIQAHKDKLKAEAEKREHKQELQEAINATKDSANAVIGAIAGEAQRTRQHTQKVEVTNQPKIEVEHTTDFKPLISALKEVKSAVDKVAKDIKIPKSEKVESVSVSNLNDYSAQLKEVITAVKSIELSPNINVATPDVKITTPDISKEIMKITKAIKELKFPKSANFDTSKLESAMTSVKRAINGLSFPVPNYVLPFSSEGKGAQVSLTSGAIPTVSGLVPKIYDTVQITAYTANGDPETVVYRAGGASGTVVATLTLTYDGSNRITEVVRT